MNHLSVDEIIEFVSSSELNDDEIEIIKSVNEHIRKCPKCLKMVQAFQLIYDEFNTLCLQDDFKNYVYSIANLKEDDIELDGYR